MIVLLSLILAALVGVALGALYTFWVGGLAAGVWLLLTWGLERATGVRVRLGRWPLAVLAPLVWGVTGGIVLSQWMQRDTLSSRTVTVAPLKQDVEVEANVSANRIQVEKDRLIYTLTVRYRKGIKPRIPKITAHPIFNGPFVMPAKSPPKIRFTTTNDGVKVKRWKLTLVAVSSGPLNTPRFVIRYRKDNKTHKVIVPQIAVDVGEIKQTQKLLTTLRPSKAPVLPEAPQDPTQWVWWAVLAGSLFLGLGGVVWLSRREGYKPPPLPPHEWFQREFTRLERQRLLDKQEFKAHFFGLSEIFRGYLERRFAFPALESTTEEIAQWSRQHDEFSQDVSRDIRKTLQAMEAIKFAGHQPDDAETDDITNRIHAIVRRTRHVADPTQSARTKGGG